MGWKNYVEDVPSSDITTAAVVQGKRIVSNIKTRESDDFWRFQVLTGATSATVEIDFGVNCAVGAVSIQFPRGTYSGVSESNPAIGPTDTIQIELLDASDSVLWDSTEVDSGVVPGYMVFFLEVDPVVTSRKMRVTIDAPSRISAAFCDVATIGAWAVISPAVGFSYPADFGWKLNNERDDTPAGRTYTARFEPMRRWTLEFDALTNAESMAFDEMVRVSGGARQVFIRRGDLPAGYDAMHALVTPERGAQSRNATHRQMSLTFDEFI